jgi:steroid 5-alpha reductase family enzyme
MIKDHIQRGDYTNHIAPKLIFSAIRITGAITGMFLFVYWTDGFSNLSDVLENLPVMLFYACIFLAVSQQLYWVWFIARERFSWFMALFPWNTALDWLWIYFLSQALNSGLRVNVWVYIGGIICIAGLSIELISNFQRHYFKLDPKNEGKLFTGGLFSIVIHPNYTGYLLWRSAFPLMTGYPLLAVIAFIFHFSQFYFQAHPPFQRYMHLKYGQAWERYAAERKKIVPGVL